MKRIEIEIDEETDALLDSMLTGAGERAKPSILRRFVEEGVERMARSSSLTEPASANVAGQCTDADKDVPRDLLDAIERKYPGASERWQRLAPPSPLDAIVGSIHDDPVDDIDEVIYGR